MCVTVRKRRREIYMQTEGMVWMDEASFYDNSLHVNQHTRSQKQHWFFSAYCINTINTPISWSTHMIWKNWCFGRKWKDVQHASLSPVSHWPKLRVNHNHVQWVFACECNGSQLRLVWQGCRLEQYGPDGCLDEIFARDHKKLHLSVGCSYSLAHPQMTQL